METNWHQADGTVVQQQWQQNGITHAQWSMRPFRGITSGASPGPDANCHRNPAKDRSRTPQVPRAAGSVSDLLGRPRWSPLFRLSCQPFRLCLGVFTQNQAQHFASRMQGVVYMYRRPRQSCGHPAATMPVTPHAVCTAGNQQRSASGLLMPPGQTKMCGGCWAYPRDRPCPSSAASPSPCGPWQPSVAYLLARCRR